LGIARPPGEEAPPMNAAYRMLLILAVMLAWFVPTAHARWYDPTTGRWLQRDPLGSHTLIIAQQADGVVPELGYVDGMNRYEYVGSDPLSGIDPEGLRDLTKAEREGVCNRIQQRRDSGQLDVNSYRSARKNFDCDGVGIGERIGRALTGAFVATCGSGYGYVDCLAECVDENSSLIANIIGAAGNLPPQIGGNDRAAHRLPIHSKGKVDPKTGKWRNPRLGGAHENTTSWRRLFQKLPKGLQGNMALNKLFAGLGKANAVVTIGEGAYMAAVEAYCVGHCAGLPSGQRYQSNAELRAKQGASSP
jgi:RHS repeat-associated protein